MEGGKVRPVEPEQGYLSTSDVAAATKGDDDE